MFGKEENDGFLDGLGRRTTEIVTNLLIVGVIWLSIIWYINTWKSNPLKALFITIILIFFIIAGNYKYNHPF